MVLILTTPFLEQIIVNAILLGLVYGMVGLGLSLVLGIMNVLNISHGTMYILGGFLTYYVSEQLHYSPVLGFLFAAAVTFSLGVFFEVVFIHRVSNDPTRVMLITFGLAIIIGQISLLIWGGTAIPTPAIVGQWVHGGGWSGGFSKRRNSSRRLSRSLSRSGPRSFSECRGLEKRCAWSRKIQKRLLAWE